MQEYDFNVSSSSRRRTLVVGVGVGVVLLVVVFGAWRWWAASRAKENAAISKIVDVLQNCADATDPALCEKERAESLVANGSSDASLCDQLEGADRDSCLWASARSSDQVETCRSIENGEMKGLCEEEIILSRALKGDDTRLCGELTDTYRAEACDKTIRQNLVAMGRCTEAYDDATCADYVRLDTAVSAKDPDLCSEVKTPRLNEDCLDIIGVGDRDNDGLDATSEAVLGTDDRKADTDNDGLTDLEESDGGTDPLKPDTDDDGFTDKDEMANGYDPLAPASN